MSDIMATRIGIMDIGSNSIRLVIYEINEQGAYRVVSEHKDSARLSERMGPDQILHSKDILSIVPILNHYMRLCKIHAVSTVRAVATAAVRNAANTAEINRVLEEQTGLQIEVLSGYEEARYGYLGVINAIDVQDAFIIDIGGGSTEVSLMRDGKLMHSHSFSFGAVNTTRQYMNGAAELGIAAIRDMVQVALTEHPWIGESPALPMIGLGGTIRTLGKMSRKHNKYPLQLAHNYELKQDELHFFLTLLSGLPLEKRKKIDGLAKERADIIVPGLLILETIFAASKASSCIISGSGLRDGLFFETFNPEQPVKPDVLEASLQNVLSLHPNAARNHVQQVDTFAMKLYDTVAPLFELDSRCRKYMHTAALLHRIGVSVHYYQYLRHTQYMMQEAHINGLSHREIVIASLIATYKTKSRTAQQVLVYKDLLLESDTALIVKLGTLLQVARALDISETQPVQELNIQCGGAAISLQLVCNHDPQLELKELLAAAKDFEKTWELSVLLHPALFP